MKPLLFRILIVSIYILLAACSSYPQIANNSSGSTNTQSPSNLLGEANKTYTEAAIFKNQLRYLPSIF